MQSTVIIVGNYKIPVDEAPGSIHDFKLCKETLLVMVGLMVIILADSGLSRDRG